MSIRRHCCIAAWGVSAVLLPAAPGEAGERPNFVLVMGDDHGWDETGHPWVETPVLDEMAREGLRLDRFYSGGPSCSPRVPMLLIASDVTAFRSR